jgi:hypothetical protein
MMPPDSPMPHVPGCPAADSRPLVRQPDTEQTF